MEARLIPPEIPEPVRRQCRVDGRAGDRPMAEHVRVSQPAPSRLL
jgi:hypothetical protein